MTVVLGNRADVWVLHKGRISGTVKTKASASAMGREVILEVWGGRRMEKWGYSWGCERREFFMFVFYADGNDSGEKGRY